MIIVKPNGGLGNRMRVIHSALLLANITRNRKLKILWKKDEGLNAGFFDLFEPIDCLSVEEGIWKMAIFFYGTKKILRYNYFDDIRTTLHQFDISYFQKLGRNFLLNTCMDFLPVVGMENRYSIFKPVGELQKKIDLIKNLFNGDTIGIQIRRTDHQIAREKSKTEDFIAKMKKLVELNSHVKFFLSTDDESVATQIEHIFKEKIIIQQDKSLSRNSLEGIQAALVDMFALSATKFILGSQVSSFGEVASNIGSIPIEFVGA